MGILHLILSEHLSAGFALEGFLVEAFSGHQRFALFLLLCVLLELLHAKLLPFSRGKLDFLPDGFDELLVVLLLL